MVVLVFSVVVILIGISTVFGYKRKQSHTRKNSCHNEGFPAGPLYEEIQPNSTSKYQDLVELQDNVAYGPIVRI